MNQQPNLLPTIVKRSNDLPQEFSQEERHAYDWLYDCGIRPWFVDMLTRRVRDPNGEYDNLVEYAKSKGMK